MTARPSPVLIAPLDPERIAADWPKARAALAERGHVEPEILQVLADQIEHRRDGCQVLLAIEIGSVANALGLGQADIDEAFELAGRRS